MRRFALPLALLLVTLLSPHATPANSADVTVTARIAPVFSMSMLGPTVIDFGQVELGGVYELPNATRILIRSNRPWEFIDSSEPYMSVGNQSVPRETFLLHRTSLAFGPHQIPGNHLIECDYVLDLTPVEAFDLPTDASLTATFGYTVVQR